MTQKYCFAIIFLLSFGISVVKADQLNNQSSKNSKTVKEQMIVPEIPVPDIQPMFKLGVFGTLGVLHSSQSSGDYILESAMPTGAGRSDEWDLNNYSKLAVQLNGYFAPKFSGQFQVVTAYDATGDFQPEVEWVNLKYSFNQDAYLRLGRIGLPTFFDSGNHDVGYSYTWAHPPSELYYLLPIQSSDGIDAMYRSKFGQVRNSTKMFYGSNIHDGKHISTTSHDMWGIFDSIEYGQTTFHVDFQKRNTTTEINSSGSTDGGVDCTDISIGVSYDPDDWFVMSEWVQSRTKFASNAMYIGAGYHFNKFAPYVLHSQVTPGSLPQDYTPSSSGFDVLRIASRSQQTNSLGVRWDFKKNFDFKFQYDNVTLGDNSNGFLVNVPPSVTLYGSNFSLFSAVIDFVF